MRIDPSSKTAGRIPFQRDGSVIGVSGGIGSQDQAGATAFAN